MKIIHQLFWKYFSIKEKDKKSDSLATSVSIRIIQSTEGKRHSSCSRNGVLCVNQGILDSFIRIKSGDFQGENSFWEK